MFYHILANILTASHRRKLNAQQKMFRLSKLKRRNEFKIKNHHENEYRLLDTKNFGSLQYFRQKVELLL